jgi:aminopeptidase N
MEPLIAVPMTMPPADTSSRVESLAGEIAASLEFMTASFGPPPLKTLTVSPVPGAFGQGFPGLLYLSTLSYLSPADRPLASNSETNRLFLSEILHAHETAHQWWGNTVTAAGYPDEWLMESLANYSALLCLERRKGARVLDSILQEYKARLLAPSEDGRSVESVGPIVLGPRLRTSLAPDAWRAITYEKGSWIMHMLRRKLGDERFLAMLKELCRRYRYQGVTTEQFRGLVQGNLPPKSSDSSIEEFFERWVYGTGIPTLKLAWNVRGKAPNLTLRAVVTQTGVEEDFSVEVPVEVQLARGRTITRMVRTSSSPASFEMRVVRSPLKVLLDPSQSVLAVRD